MVVHSIVPYSFKLGDDMFGEESCGGNFDHLLLGHHALLGHVDRQQRVAIELHLNAFGACGADGVAKVGLGSFKDGQLEANKKTNETLGLKRGKDDEDTAAHLLKAGEGIVDEVLEQVVSYTEGTTQRQLL